MKNLFKRVATLAVASILSAFAVQSASAGGDLVRDYPAMWQGAYFGAHIGGGFGEVDTDGYGDFDVDGVVGGVHLGYNIQKGKTVFGIEGDFSWSGADVELPNPYREEIDQIDQNYLASIRARLGYAHNSSLFYVTGGVAWTEFEEDGDEASETGYVIGAGVDHKFNDKLSLRGEVLHYGFDYDDADYNTTVVRTGISYSFN